MSRLFVGIAIPDQIRAAFPDLYRSVVDGVRPTQAGDHHITLHFLGNVDDDVADAVREALHHVVSQTMTLTLTGVGCFGGKRRQRILWAGVEESAPLYHLHREVGRAIESVGLALETRLYNPHVTLARLNRPAFDFAEPFIAAHANFTMSLPVDRFSLYRVHAKDAPIHYEPWCNYPLIKR